MNLAQNINGIIEQCYESVYFNKLTRRRLDVKYKKADLNTSMSKCTYLSKKERTALHKLLLCCEDLFDGTLETWNGPEIDLKVAKDAIPYFARPFPVPQIHERTLKIEIN
jgi:hypothetical protein